MSILPFAYDTIFFSKASWEHLQNLKIILLVSREKSILGINTNQELVSRLASILDCRETNWPLPYLGLPLGGNPNLRGFWDSVVEKVARRLDG